MSEFLEFDLTLRLGEFFLSAAAKIPLTGITALSGPSGSGKTTLLRAISGLEPAAEGRVHFSGDDWSDLGPAGRSVGYVFQDSRLFPHLNVSENLRYGAVRRGIHQDRIDAIVDALDLHPLLPRMPATLSGGETRRVALGRALASGPRILLMDEPLSGLDQERKFRLMPYISRAVADFGVPALYVTHSSEELTFLADRTLTIQNGKLGGWSEVSPRLMGTVTHTDRDGLELAVGSVSVRVPGQGRVGETWALLLGDDFLVSSESPGVSNAALSLRARVVEIDEGRGQCIAELENQRVALPWQCRKADLPDSDTVLWLSIPRVLARPVQSPPESKAGGHSGNLRVHT